MTAALAATTPAPTRGEEAVTSARDVAAERAYDRMRAQLADGELDAAEESARQFLVRWRRDPLVGRVSLVLAEVELARVEGDGFSVETGELPQVAPGRLAAARLALDAAAETTDEPTRARIELMLGVFALLEGRPEECLARLTPLRSTLVFEHDRRLRETSIYLAARRDDASAALVALDELRAMCRGEADCARIDDTAGELTRDGLDDAAALELALQADPTRPSYASLARRVVAASARAGDFDTIRAVVRRARAAGTTLDAETRDIARRIEQGLEADRYTIGVVAPLSGPDSQRGARMVEAIARAAGLPHAGRPAPDAWRIIVRDSRGLPDEAARGVSELFYLHRAIAVIGPPDVACAMAAGARASALGLPFVSMTTLPDRPFVHAAGGAADDMVDIARRRVGADIGVVGPRTSEAHRRADVHAVAHVGGRLSATARAELEESPLTAWLLEARAVDVPRLVAALADLWQRRRPRPELILTETQYRSLDARARRALEGAMVVGLGASGGADAERNAPLAERAEAALRSITTAGADTRARLEAALAASATPTIAARVYRLRAGALVAD